VSAWPTTFALGTGQPRGTVTDGGAGSEEVPPLLLLPLLLAELSDCDGAGPCRVKSAGRSGTVSASRMCWSTESAPLYVR